MVSCLNPFSPNNRFSPEIGAGAGNRPQTRTEIEIRESRPFTPQELSDLRREYAQNGMKDATYMVRLWKKGADTVILHEMEMRAK